MSKDWVQDMNEMHSKSGVHDWVMNNPEKLKDFLRFRIDFLKEELDETNHAFDTKDPEEIVDGLIDLCVIAIGTLDAFNVDAYEAWNKVFKANMAKEIGIKKERPNPLGLPDLVKPAGWENPNHNGNHGLFTNAF
jgi:hypothetical protein